MLKVAHVSGLPEVGEKVALLLGTKGAVMCLRITVSYQRQHTVACHDTHWPAIAMVSLESYGSVRVPRLEDLHRTSGLMILTTTTI